MNEHEPRPAEEREGIDWRRLDVALTRYLDRIAAGIELACVEGHEIDHDTARMIAHVLGRGYGRDSHLATFGREGEGDYAQLRDEYLALYNASDTSAEVKELVNWLGTYIVQRENLGSGQYGRNEQSPRNLERVLVDTWITIEGQPFLTHVPGSYDGSAIEGLTETLAELRLAQDEGLQAFLSLPDVNAMSGDIMGSFDQAYYGAFRTIEEAAASLTEVDELEREVDEFAAERGLYIDSVTPDYEVLAERAREAYDLVERKGCVYVFVK